MTIEPPNNIPIVGRGCLIQARVCRNKRDSKGEQCAKELSDVNNQATFCKLIESLLFFWILYND